MDPEEGTLSSGSRREISTSSLAERGEVEEVAVGTVSPSPAPGGPPI